MTDHRPPPPEPEDCLTCSRASRYKGGTLVAEEVLDLAAHLQRIADPDGYRPADKAKAWGHYPQAFWVIAVIDATFRGGASPDTRPMSRNVTGSGSGDRRPSSLPLRAL